MSLAGDLIINGLYYLAIGPIALASRLAGIDPLAGPTLEPGSFWNPRAKGDSRLEMTGPSLGPQEPDNAAGGYVLGLDCFYHDSAAVLLHQGRVRHALEEERFTRAKHTSDFPAQAVAEALRREKITSADLEAVAFYELPRWKFSRIISTHLAQFPHSKESFAAFAPLWLSRNMRMEMILRRKLGEYRGPMVFVEHHLAHAASAFYPSPFREAAILTIDGAGEWATTTSGQGCEDEIILDREIRFPHSLGLLYSAITDYLGFKVNSGEGKVMGLTSYGRPSFRKQFGELIEIAADGSFRLNMEYFNYHRGLTMTAEKFDRLFGCRREPESEIKTVHEDLAATLQSVLEEAILKMAQDLARRSGLKNLCIAGGVGLNSVTNGKILAQTPFTGIFVQPASSDAGASLGAALYYDVAIKRRNRRYRMDHAHLGTDATPEEMCAALEERKISFRRLDEPSLVDAVAELLAADRMVGWFQGRMEFGPRALGNRSILASARHPRMKEILNARVKHREPFRPYAASLPREACARYFDRTDNSPFMLLVYNVKEEMKSEIPAVTHVDGTCRVQTLTAESDGLYHRLVCRYGELTGHPIILNTSFNVRGEPIVRTPAEAINCFLNTDLDALVLGPCLAIKERPGVI